MMSRLSPSSRSSRESSCQAELTQLPTLAFISLPEAFEKGKGQCSSMYGYFYRDLDLKQIYIYKHDENDKKRLYTQRGMDVEQGTFTPLVFTTSGGMGEECKRYHNRLAELVAAKKGMDYATTVSFAILRSALLCLRGSRTAKRPITSNLQEVEFELHRYRAKI